MKKYICPMHPDIKKDEPGSCPKCGMDLVEVDEKADKGHDTAAMDHTQHHAKMAEDFRKRFWLALPLTLIVLVFSPREPLVGDIDPGFGFSFRALDGNAGGTGYRKRFKGTR